ncbi:DUF305 domain-containing protein [Xylanimonas oleitrophica]|uniref:DUF305 domain-containing protein n=1 Tax=Xylanimonas oleitrophica TaxID=2607479 RepID=A0A2W5WZ00_9MICO|nr:DUF305 domain-containing protein [Xylanimonas oleitrophica]PZR53085.1 DUF305 domain-containing protein [Xylanimonas oleitrophica]
MTPSSVVVQPGRPGEDNRTVAPEDYTYEGSAEGPHNDADVAFVTRMIVHHAQALEMAALAPDRASSPQVLSFADRVAGAQAAEIRGLAGWLDARELPRPPEADLDQAEPGPSAPAGSGPRAPGHGGHGQSGHEDMPGMVSDDDLAALEAASGTEFDRLFLELMIRHHLGAVDMADDALRDGSDLYANEIATDTSVGQTAEINRMRDILAGL